jgi:hypothetical protein
MKKNTIFLKTAGKAAGLLAVLLALGLALAGCDNGATDNGSDNGGGNNDQTPLTIPAGMAVAEGKTQFDYDPNIKFNNKSGRTVYVQI